MKLKAFFWLSIIGAVAAFVYVEQRRRRYYPYNPYVNVIDCDIKRPVEFSEFPCFGHESMELSS